MKKMFIILVLIVVTFSLSAGEINFGGLVQTWFSYTDNDGSGDSPYGFGIKRLEFSPFGSINEKINWGFMVGWDNNAVRLFDAFLDFQISKQFKLKIGRFSVPGTVSASLSPSGDLDLIERAAITMHWAGNNTLAGERSLGIQAYGDLADGKLYYALMIANNGNLSDNFTPSIKSASHEYQNAGLYLWGRLEAKLIDGLRIGTFLGNGNDNESELKRTSYGAHLFYLKNSINFKAEYIAGKNDISGIYKLKYNGMYFVIGYRIDKIEPVIRYDFVEPNNGNADEFGVEKYNNISLGINYNYSKRVRFQLNYIIKNERMAQGFDKLNNNIFYVNVQYGY